MNWLIYFDFSKHVAVLGRFGAILFVNSSSYFELLGGRKYVLYVRFLPEIETFFKKFII